MRTTVLVVDDELLIRKSLAKVLRARGCPVEVASNGAEGLEKVTEVRPQVMILDMRLPDTDGLSVLRRVRQLDPLLQVIVITAFGDVQTAVDAMKLGANDFLRKPYEMEDIVMAVEAAGRTFRQASELDVYRRQAWKQYSGEEIIGESDPITRVRELIDKVVRS
ncbi:MAG: sigma-54-dependent transcriptional regulator, partial [Candidatus Eisenbacteria bacterium]